MDTPRTVDSAHIGPSVNIKGQLSGSEDLYVDGQVEGSIDLHANNLTVGPNGHIRADVNAKGVVLNGKVDGNIHATDRIELRKSAVVSGDIFTRRIVIEDGAYFKGKVEIQKDTKPESSQTNSEGVKGSVPTPAVTTSTGS